MGWWMWAFRDTMVKCSFHSHISIALRLLFFFLLQVSFVTVHLSFLFSEPAISRIADPRTFKANSLPHPSHSCTTTNFGQVESELSKWMFVLLHFKMFGYRFDREHQKEHEGWYGSEERKKKPQTRKKEIKTVLPLHPLPPPLPVHARTNTHTQIARED